MDFPLLLFFIETSFIVFLNSRAAHLNYTEISKIENENLLLLW